MTIGSASERKERRRCHHRTGSAMLVRRPSLKLSPWDMS